MNMLVRSAAVIAAAPTMAAASADSDPVFAALAAHRSADKALAEAYDALEAAERELKKAGDLEPYVESVGNPWGAGGFRSTSHEQIDLYSPADMYPDRNRAEHAALAASIARRDARLNPLQKAVKVAEDVELKARYRVDEIEPTTFEGALAALTFTRKYTL
ncbi:hypothetical protein [Bradyrhizobium sp. UFLA05-112]